MTSGYQVGKIHEFADCFLQIPIVRVVCCSGFFCLLRRADSDSGSDLGRSSVLMILLVIKFSLISSVDISMSNSDENFLARFMV